MGALFSHVYWAVTESLPAHHCWRRIIKHILITPITWHLLCILKCTWIHVALTSFASESSSSSAAKETTCVGHCPWKSTRFWSLLVHRRTIMWHNTLPSSSGPWAFMSWSSPLPYRKEVSLPSNYHCLWKPVDGGFLISSGHIMPAPSRGVNLDLHTKHWTLSLYFKV